jgi:hypothetical protein
VAASDQKDAPSGRQDAPNDGGKVAARRGFYLDPTPSGSPRYRVPKLDSPQKLVQELNRQYRRLMRGELPLEAYGKVVYGLSATAKILEASDLQQRVEALERQRAAKEGKDDE